LIVIQAIMRIMSEQLDRDFSTSDQYIADIENSTGSGLSGSPSPTPSFVPKASNFRMKRGYQVLLDMHREFAPFDSEVALSTWREWFKSDIQGDLRKLLEACMFAHGLIPTASQVWFDDTDYDAEDVDPLTETFVKWGVEDVKCPKQRKFRNLLKNSKALVTNCLQDLISDKFQSIYLGNRQESGENWIRMANIILLRTRKGTIKASKIHLPDLTNFILGDKKLKQKVMEKYHFNNQNRFKVIGKAFGQCLQAEIKYEINNAIVDFAADILDSQSNRESGNYWRSTNPAFRERPKLHVTMFKRGVGLAKQAYGSQYMANAGAAFAKGIFNKSTLSATAKVYGVQATLEDYNRIALTQDVESLLSEFRNELPVLARLLKVMTKRHWNAKFETFHALRLEYAVRGLTPAGWRLLKKISPIDIRKLLSEGVAFSLCYFLRKRGLADQSKMMSLLFLSEVGVFCQTKPRAGLLPALKEFYGAYRDNWSHRTSDSTEHGDHQRHFFRAIAQHVLASTDSVQNLRNLCSDATDALRYSQPARINELIGPRKITTARAMRILQIAHAEVVREGHSQRGVTAYAWPAALKEFFYKEFVFYELCDTEAAFKEGGEMHHCIGGYDMDCAKGVFRIFSGKIVGSESRSDRISIALRKVKDGAWKVQQVRGFSNRPASRQELSAARALCTQLTKEIQKIELDVLGDSAIQR
jgi:hypothetical protein